MSLIGTLAKVAIGVAVAKGVGGMLQGAAGQAQRRTNPGNAGNGGLFGGTHSPGAGQSRTGLEDMMGDLLGGRTGGGANAGAGGQSGGLGGILEQLAGGAQRGGGAGGLGDLIGGLTKGAQGGGAGGLGDLLGGLTGGASQKQNGSFGDLLNQSIQKRGEPEVAPSQDQEAMAGLMLSAMIQAAKSDGVVDEEERKRLLDNLGDVSPQERAFVENELNRPVDAKHLAGLVPGGMEKQVYLMSLMGINLDNQKEAQYLHDLATSMNVGKDDVNAVHDHLGVPRLYT